ncbi:MAG: hypothetical protein U0414_10635 [Polyangiaceae bacterium]
MPNSLVALGGVGVVFLAFIGCETASSAGGGNGGEGGSNSAAHDDSSVPCKEDPCSADEICGVCHYALGDGHQCHLKEVPQGASFACDWLACAAGEACVHVAPKQDGCFEAACEPLPPECAVNPTCACVEAAIAQTKPSGTFGYHVTSCAADGGHASVTAFLSL